MLWERKTLNIRKDVIDIICRLIMFVGVFISLDKTLFTRVYGKGYLILDQCFLAIRLFCPRSSKKHKITMTENIDLKWVNQESPLKESTFTKYIYS